MPEDPPWYELFRAEKKDICEVCRVMVDLYSRTADSFQAPQQADAPLEVSPSPVQQEEAGQVEGNQEVPEEVRPRQGAVGQLRLPLQTISLGWY